MHITSFILCMCYFAVIFYHYLRSGSGYFIYNNIMITNKNYWKKFLTKLNLLFTVMT